MKSNELFEEIHMGTIKNGTKLRVETEGGDFIAFLIYKNNYIQALNGEDPTKYFCNIDIEFEVDNSIEELPVVKLDGLDDLVKEIILHRDKINELVKEHNRLKEE